ncbi:LCP family protein [Brevibacterium sp. JNUCC-42]|nr:LCP family protein [Brevibacterium sp. JNUCC-42]
MNKYLKISLPIFLILIIAASSYAYFLYKSIERHVEEMQITFEENPVLKKSENEKGDEGSLLFLLLGIGDRPGDPGRADSIIVISVNRSDKSAIMFNIPRDTRTELIGKGIQDKINHSYAYGRTEMTKKTVEHFLNRSVDYVIQVNMGGLRQLVDAFGGVEVVNDFPFEEKDELGKKVYHYDKGLIQLDGERALHYSRMRKLDPKGDLGRNERQQQVLMALLQKATSFSSVFKIQDILGILGSNIKTSISFEEMKSFYSEFKKDWDSFEIESLEIEGTNRVTNGTYYYEVSESERERLSNRLKEHSELSHSIDPSTEREINNQDANLESMKQVLNEQDLLKY